MRQTNGKGILLIKKFEGLRLRAYRDAGLKILTVGYGHTGPDVHVGQVITDRQAEWLLKTDLVRFEIAVDNLVTSAVSQNQFDALVSFAFNLGAGTLKKSTLLKKVNADPNDPTIMAEFAKYVKAGGRVLKGLIARRVAEAELYFEP